MSERPPGLEKPGVLDAFAYDRRADKLVLAMFETRPWTDEDWQLMQLQEKLNAYLSFILDGEMTEAFPQYLGKPIEIQLRTATEPGDRAMEFIASARTQLELQHIGLVVVLTDEEPSAASSSSCGCGSGGGCCSS